MLRRDIFPFDQPLQSTIIEIAISFIELWCIRTICYMLVPCVIMLIDWLSFLFFLDLDFCFCLYTLISIAEEEHYVYPPYVVFYAHQLYVRMYESTVIVFTSSS